MHMRVPRGVVLATVTALVLACAGTPALAISGAPGGAAAPSSPQGGGSEFGVPVSAGAAPVVSVLSVPRSARPGRPPRVTFRIDEPGTGTVYVQVAIDNLATRRQAVLATIGWAHTGRTLSVSWPAGARLTAGTYHVSISAHDHHGKSLLRRARTSGVADAHRRGAARARRAGRARRAERDRGRSRCPHARADRRRRRRLPGRRTAQLRRS